MSDRYKAEGIVAGPNNPCWRGDSGNRGKYWKQKARERDDFTCQHVGCGIREEGKGMHAHHVIPRRLRGPDTLENLVTLCASHHMKVEHLFLKELWRLAPDFAQRAVDEIFDFCSGDE